jgi:hypothetical protein
MNFKYIKISFVDYLNIDKLINSTFNISSNISSKLNTFYAKDRNLGIIAYNDDNLLCCTYLSYPIFVIINNEKIALAQSGDSITHPNYLGYNLITNCALKNYEILQNNNYKAVFGFPSKNIFRTRIKLLNWTKVYDMKSFNIFIPTIPIFNIYKTTYIKDLHLRWVKFIIKIFYQNGVFFDSSNSYLRTGYVDRSKEFWEYKLLKKNKFLIKINNVDIIFKLEDYLYIGDINIDKIKNRLLFKLNLLLFSILIFCPIIKTYASPGSNIEKLLKPISQINISLPFCIKKFDQSLNIQNLNFTYFDYDTF